MDAGNPGIVKTEDEVIFIICVRLVCKVPLVWNGFLTPLYHHAEFSPLKRILQFFSQAGHNQRKNYWI